MIPRGVCHCGRSASLVAIDVESTSRVHDCETLLTTHSDGPLDVGILLFCEASNSHCHRVGSLISHCDPGICWVIAVSQSDLRMHKSVVASVLKLISENRASHRVFSDEVHAIRQCPDVVHFLIRLSITLK